MTRSVALLWTLVSSTLALPGCAPPELLPGRPFVVAWNHPFFVCKYTNFNLSDYGILANPDKGWFGERMNIFYSVGNWPRIEKDWIFVNGGIPQLMNLTAHLEKAKTDIESLIPNASHVGLGVIDMESWRPLYSTNWGGFRVYQHHSQQLVLQQHPDWKDADVTAEAERQFERAARQAMTETLKLAKQLRPGLRWGYYLYPSCYAACDEWSFEANGRLSWLYAQSSALYPSIYHKPVEPTIFHSLLVHANFSRPDVPVLPYTLIQRGPLEFYPPQELDHAVKTAADMGASGVVIWGSSFNFRVPNACSALAKYLHSTLGPYVSALSQHASLCSQMLCSGHGRCILKKYAWSLEQMFQKHEVLQDSCVEKPAPCRRRRHSSFFQRPMSVNVSHAKRAAAAMFAVYTCRCYAGWGGRHCGVPSHRC